MVIISASRVYNYARLWVQGFLMMFRTPVEFAHCVLRYFTQLYERQLAIDGYCLHVIIAARRNASKGSPDCVQLNTL